MPNGFLGWPGSGNPERSLISDLYDIRVFSQTSPADGIHIRETVGLTNCQSRHAAVCAPRVGGAITGSIEITARIVGPSGSGAVVSTNDNDNHARGGWQFEVGANGLLTFYFVRDATSNITTTNSTANSTATSGASRWVRVTRDVTSGTVTFYEAADQEAEPSSWTQVGTPQVAAAGTLMRASENAMVFGHNADVWGNSPNNFFTGGTIRRVIVRDGIGASPAVDVNFAAQQTYARRFAESANASLVTVMPASLQSLSGTWTKPAGATWVKVWAIGGGGGGSSGRKGASLSARSGGAGGGGAGWAFAEFHPDALPATVPVTIGGGGPGGPAVSRDSFSGLLGRPGNTTIFGTFLSANGGIQGQSGGAGSNPAGQSGAGCMYSNVNGGGSTSTAVSAQGNGSSNQYTGGGAGGGGITAGDVVNVLGIPGTPQSRNSLEPWYTGCIGGYGGAGKLSGAPGHGSTGLGYGAGGGGGGAGTDGAVDAGGGADGTDGAVIVVTYKGPVNVQSFTSSGQWRKPRDSRLTTARIVVASGGGGGGSGRRGATGTARCGGGGGGGAGWHMVDVPLALLDDTVIVTVGAGGVGAAGIAVDDTDGAAGGAGGDSSFGSIAIAYGAGGGGGGGNGVAGGGGGGARGGFLAVVAGGAASATGGGGGSGGSLFAMSAGGSAGAGITTANVTSAGGGAVACQPVAHFYARAIGTPITSGPGIYGGDGGAGGNTNNAAINGAAGATRGGGGGGGAASTNGSVSGAGGTGGDGYVLVVCF